MMLTNLFPNGGNGTFTIHVIATDVEMNETTLGTRILYCDNASAVKPFGTIDTPIQGGVASGSNYFNFGWVLTPLPNTIPVDGSTIFLWINGQKLASNAVYNLYRADIYDLFPYHNNSSGPAGFFNIDTTAYDNGAHTIQWTATDDYGNSDGIGSRYMTIQNREMERAGNRRKMEPPFRGFEGSFAGTPGETGLEIFYRIGYDTGSELEYVEANRSGKIKIKIKPVERLEIHLDGQDIAYYGSECEWKGGLLIGKEWKPIPIGSSLDRAKGIFYWQPCAGFLGKYRLVFYKTLPDGGIYRKQVEVKILPHSGKHSGK